MWDVLPRTVYQPVANTQAIQFDASTLQVGDLYDLCRCLSFFTPSFVHRRCTVLSVSTVTHYVNIHQFWWRCGPWWYSNQLGIWQFQRETLRHRTDFYCSCAVLAVPRMLKVMLILVGQSTWPYATHSMWHAKANCGSCQRSVCCLRLYFWLYWKQHCLFGTLDEIQVLFFDLFWPELFFGGTNSYTFFIDINSSALNETSAWCPVIMVLFGVIWLIYDMTHATPCTLETQGCQFFSGVGQSLDTKCLREIWVL